jgi:hypothetical protein
MDDAKTDDVIAPCRPQTNPGRDEPSKYPPAQQPSSPFAPEVLPTYPVRSFPTTLPGEGPPPLIGPITRRYT